MAVTQNNYTGNGSTVLYSFTFPYLDESHVKVSINGTPTTAYSLANATTIQFNSAPSNGAAIRIYRETTDTEPVSTFYPGSAIRSQDLNDNFLQSLYLTQETETLATNQSTAGLQAQITAATDTANSAITTANIATSTANTASANVTAVSNTANTALSVANAAMPKAGGTFIGDVIFNTTTSTKIPVGTSGQRPGTPTAGMIRFNSSILQYEGYNGTAWGTIGGGAKGGGTDQVFIENDQTVTTNYTLTAGKNAVTAGPITVNNGITVTIPSGSSWTIV
jgi:hypothetical protein